MLASCASLTSRGAGRPGIKAVVMTMSCLAMWPDDQLGLRAWYSGLRFAGIAAAAFALDAGDTSTKIGLAPSDWICSLVAERTSVALTCAPGGERWRSPAVRRRRRP